MRLRTAVVISLAAILLLLLCTSAFSASTCWVNGRLTIHHSCAARTINLWIWVTVNVETGEKAWVHVGQKTLMDNEQFSFLVNCGPECYAPAEIRSACDVLHEFNLPGRGNTAYVGTIYDPNHCSKIPESAIPDPNR